jgi:hypothetical protein
VPGPLDKKGGRRGHILQNKDGIFLPPFLSKKTGTGVSFCYKAETFQPNFVRVGRNDLKQKLLLYSSCAIFETVDLVTLFSGF